MKLISKIDIKGFRSIRDGSLEALGDFTALAGLNNSGKSNAFRALNAFFSGETDLGQRLDVDADYYRPDFRKQKKKKRISVTVEFMLPGQFRFPKALQHVESFLGGRSFRIGKDWVRDEPQPSYCLNGGLVDLKDRQKIDQFLQLITFRYIANRILPVEIIRSEHRALRDSLVRRLSKKAKEHEKAFEAIRDISRSMIAPLVARLREACPDIGDIRLATPTSWSDLAFAFGYRLGQNGVEIDDAAQGAGIQSLLMLETLYLIDRDYFQKFGWRQAAIWAVEEPESSLHASLEAKVARYLRSISSEPGNRLQILCTTHSGMMVQHAEKAIMAERASGKTEFVGARDTKDALDRCSRAGISQWSHPILYYPSEPLVLVDGKYDQAFLEEGFRLLRPQRFPRVLYLEQLADDGSTGGTDAVLTYLKLKANARAIKLRPQESPVIVLLDWDAKDKQQAFKRPFRDEGSLRVLVWPESAFNPKLGESFGGIERHYSDRIIEEAVRRGAKIGKLADGETAVVAAKQYPDVKRILYEIVKEGLQEDDIVFARDFLEEVLEVAGCSSRKS